MNRIAPALATLICLAAPAADRKPAMTLHDQTANRLDGKPESLGIYKGKVVLAVNVASACGYTPQYEGLQKLYAEFKDQGLVVLGFPCNQFGAQEPGSAQEIAAFCSTKFQVSFPMFEKLDVKGEKQAPVYAFLTKKLGVPAWNFHKFLVGKDGKVIAAFPSDVAPESKELRAAIAAALK
jgi:glutathione peroxidase